MLREAVPLAPLATKHPMSSAASQHVQSQSNQGWIHTHRSTSPINLTHILVPCSPNRSQPEDAEREGKSREELPGTLAPGRKVMRIKG